ncbi:MAG: FixH family protein [Rhodospirillales bacterium]|nr:FixH family protein [Rhodospirillales bacterium]
MNLNSPITGRTVLLSMLAFFGVIFAVNGAFLYFALSSFPGMSTQHAYEEGVAYNQTLARAARQQAVGWVSEVAFDDNGDIAVRISNRTGAAVGGLDIAALLMRPAQNTLDQKLTLVEVQPGHYRSPVSKVIAGRWRFELSARQNGEQVYFKVHELTVPQ